MFGHLSARLTRLGAPLLTGLALVGCQTATLPDPGAPGLERISDCGALRSYAGDVITEALVDSQYNQWRYLDSAEAGGGGDAPTDYTTTNVQEEGVDELDIVKTDGKFIYVAQDRALHIVKSWPVADSEKLSTVEVDGWIRGLFLAGDKVVVLHHPEPTDGMDWGTRASVFDVTDRADPVLLREVDMEGYLADARMIDSDVYLIMNHWLPMPQAAWDLLDGRVRLPEIDWDRSSDDDFEDYMDGLRAEARRILRPRVDRIAGSMDLNEFLPEWRDRAAGEAGTVELMHGCSALYRPAGIGQHGAMSVVDLDLGNGDLKATGLLSTGWQLYASKANLYVAQNSHWWWWGSRDRTVETHIHKFALTADGEPEYVASGEVEGYAYDQFAFSEHDGYLRVATSEMDWWWGWFGGEPSDDEPANNVFVLEDDGAGHLDVVGHVGDIAPGERIYATRFMGERGYMVTFEQVDPLFTLDLSDPTDPRVVGELKIPGFSSYLHPIDDDHLLAVGMDGDDEGRVSGLAFSVFDVSDMKNPERTHYFTVEGSEWSWSEALWDHHAFTYHRDVLSVPMYQWYSGREDRWFSGVISLDATADGLSEIGRVDHRGLVRDSECLYARWYDYAPSVCDEDYWYAQVRRTIYIEDNLFSLSNYGLRVTDLNDPTVEHARVLFYPR